MINGGNHEISPLRKHGSGLADERKRLEKMLIFSCFDVFGHLSVIWETQCISPIASGGFSLCLYIEFSKTFFN